MAANRRFVRGVAACIALAATAAVAAAGSVDAEYALRWLPAQGGPTTAKQVARLLALQKRSRSHYDIRYFDVVSPADVPGGATVTLRERIEDGRAEVTWKVRGESAFPPPALALWGCPLRHEAKRKDELDVSVLSGGALRRAYSRSCTSDTTLDDAMPKTLQVAMKVRPKGCTSRMQRLASRDGTIKVEDWRLSNGERLLEVSMEGTDADADLQIFHRTIAGPLMAAGAKPLDRNKTEIGTECASKDAPAS